MEETNSSNQDNKTIKQQFGNLLVQMPVPNSAAVLVLGILSIVFCFCYGIIGLVLGIIALVLAGKGNEAYKKNPDAYTVASFNNLKARKICAIIGLILSALMLLYVIIVFVFIGTALSASGMPWGNLMNQ